MRWAFTTLHAENWHPLTWLSHMLDVQLFGLAPAGHHGVNLLLHVVNTLLLFRLLHGLTGATCRSAAVAAIFSTHPLHVESVAWVAERKDVLASFFALTAGLCHLSFLRRPRPSAAVATAFLFALGLMAKPMIVTLPFLLLLLEWWPLGRLRSTLPAARRTAFPAPGPALKSALEKAPLFLMAATTGVLAWVAQERGGAISSALPLGARVANAVLSYCGYLGKTLLPRHLAYHYPHPGLRVPTLTLLLCSLLLVLVSCSVIRLRARAPWLATGWLWYLGTLLPVIGLIQVGSQGMADRYTYLPMTGLLVAAVWSAGELSGARPRRRLIAGAAILCAIAALAVAAHAQVDTWRDDLTLFSHAVEVTRANAPAHYNLGNTLLRSGRLAEAVEQYRRALQARTDFPEACTNLGTALANLGDLEGAILSFRRALHLDPRHPGARYNLGLALARTGRHAEAAEEFRALLELSPGFSGALEGFQRELRLAGEEGRR